MHAKPAAEPLAVHTATAAPTTPHAPTTPPTTATPPPPTPTTADTDDGPRKSWVVLALALAAQILVVLDISVVNTALPSIGRDLHLDGSDMQWVVTAYLMMSGGGLLFGGRIADLLSPQVGVPDRPDRVHHRVHRQRIRRQRNRAHRRPRRPRACPPP